jgi:hypothetical protein
MLQYGVVTLEECKAHAIMYYTTRNRQAQNAQMMYACIIDSLTNDAQTNILVDVDKFTIHGYLDGLCLLKCYYQKHRWIQLQRLT